MFIKVEAVLMVDEKYKFIEVSSIIFLIFGVNNNLVMNVKKEIGVGIWVYCFGLNEVINKEVV